jgi:hypothetical protein
VTISQKIIRVVSTAYLPMAGNVLTWLIVAAGIGHADAVRTLTALIFTRASRAFLLTDTHFLLREWTDAERPIYRKSLRRALLIESASIAGSLTIIAVIIGCLHTLGQDKAAILTAILSLALPARHLASLGGASMLEIFRIALSCFGPVLVGIVLLGHLGIWAFAAALVAREWLALGAARLLRRRTVPAAARRQEPMTLLEVAAVSAARSRNRFAYRVGRTLLGFIPFGGVLARTGRSVGAHRRLAPWTGRSVYPIMAIAAGALAGAAAMPLALVKPATLLGSASLFRISMAASNVLLWWRFNDGRDTGEDEDDDD